MKPRLAENPDDLYRAIKKLTDEGVVTGQGVCYPAVQIAMVGTFRISSKGVEKQDACGGAGFLQPVSKDEIDAVHAALESDTASVVVLGRWGYHGDRAGRPKILWELHSPSGNYFGKKSE